MNGKSYDRLITILAKQETRTATGGVNTSWYPYVENIPCKVSVTGGYMDFETGQRVSNDKLRFAIRYPHSFSITAEMMVVYEGRQAKITSADENMKAPRRTEIFIEARFKDSVVYTTNTVLPYSLPFILA